MSHKGNTNNEGEVSISIENRLKLGAMLKRARQERKMPDGSKMRQIDFAEALAKEGVDVTHSVISRWERGELLIKPMNLPAISRVLGINQGDIIKYYNYVAIHPDELRLVEMFRVIQDRDPVEAQRILDMVSVFTQNTD